MAWAADPYLGLLFPDLWNFYMTNTTVNDTFVDGVDGAGYVFVDSLDHPAAYERRAGKTMATFGPNVVDVGVASNKWNATPLADIEEYVTNARAAAGGKRVPAAVLNACGTVRGTAASATAARPPARPPARQRATVRATFCLATLAVSRCARVVLRGVCGCGTRQRFGRNRSAFCRLAPPARLPVQCSSTAQSNKARPAGIGRHGRGHIEADKTVLSARAGPRGRGHEGLMSTGRPCLL